MAWATRVSPNTPNQIIESAKELLLKFIPDVYIASDHSSKEKSGKSSGFGLVLTAETKSGIHFRRKTLNFTQNLIFVFNYFRHVFIR